MRLLIMACSATKRRDPGLLPAADRYDGPLWRTMRATLVNFPESTWPRLVVLSARFGLIHANAPIPDYDQVMDKARSEELASDDDFASGLSLHGHGLDEVYVAGGKAYRDVVTRANVRLPRAMALPPIVHAPTGTTIGLMRSHLKGWLLESIIAGSRFGVADSEIEATLVPSVDPRSIHDAFGLIMGFLVKSRNERFAAVDPKRAADALKPRFPETSDDELLAIAVRSLALYNTLADPEFEQPLQAAGPHLRIVNSWIAASLPVVEVGGSAAPAKAAFRKSAFIRRFVEAVVERIRMADDQETIRKAARASPAAVVRHPPAG